MGAFGRLDNYRKSVIVRPSKANNMRDKVIIIVMSVLIVVLIDISWRESVGESASAGSLAGNLVFAEQDSPWLVSMKIPPAKETVFAWITSYSSSIYQTDSTPFLTAHQTTVDEQTVACPRYIPFHTKVVIQDKEYECLDRMNIRYKNRFDIWMPTKKLAKIWGIKKLEVIIQ